MKASLKHLIAGVLIAGTLGATGPEDALVTPELIAKHASVQPGGKTQVGVHFDIEPGWHIYYKLSGDAGLPTKIEWSAPKGASIGPILWPKPEKFLDPGDIHTMGYTGAVVLAGELKVSKGTAAGAMPIQAKVTWLACKELCVPGKASLQLSLPVSTGPQVPSTHAELFDHVS